VTGVLRRVALAASLVPLAGCTLNAVLEIELLVPEANALTVSPAPAGESLYLVAQVRDSSFAFTSTRPDGSETATTWDQTNVDPPGTRIPLDEPLTERISVVSTDEDTDLHLRVRICGDAVCPNEVGAELWFALDHPFYVGERTRWFTSIPELIDRIPSTAADVEEVWKCAIEGCYGMAYPGDRKWCQMGADIHLCEAGD
jgi:hypothetical protein